MCGISGHLNFSGAPDTDLVTRMTACLAHRGPDGTGVRTVGSVALGHRRLAIIDLSAAAGQPMCDSSGSHWIVFNGEIYNFRELRGELVKLGSRFTTESDTEVILEGYKQWGLESLSKLNGMFAFALWDDDQRRLLLARDRLGKKPLYYHRRRDGSLTFASELKALCQDPQLERTLNPRAIGQYLSLNYTLTSDAILEGVAKLAPAHFAVCSEQAPFTATRYWDIASHFHQPTACRSLDEAAEALTALVDDSVRLRLVSDVPLGVLLSGGIDSSTLAASMCQSLPPSLVRSFSMGFREKSFSEVAEARETARFLGIDHKDTETTTDVASILARIVYHGDEPFADTSVIPMFLLSAFARQHVAVCLAGDGGDEVFAGYETYVADKLHQLTQWVPAPVARGAAAAARHLMPVSFDKVSFDYKVRQFAGGQALPFARAHYHWRTIFSEDEKHDLLHPDARAAVMASDPFDEFAAFDREIGSAHYLQRAQYVDLKTWLADDILVKADRASMAHGLELRAPFLDYRIVEFAASLPVDWKLKGFQKKHVLKLSQQKRLPQSVLSRPKQGFNAPVAHWLLATFKETFRPLTLADGDTAPLFNRAAVDRLWESHLAGERDQSHKLLGLINLKLWLREFKPRPPRTH
jgi:asparagine synthase (glutamine-hydrolysing)